MRLQKVKKFWVYMTGVTPLALFHESLQSLTNGPVFLVGAIIYLLLIRVLAEKFGK